MFYKIIKVLGERETLEKLQQENIKLRARLKLATNEPVAQYCPHGIPANAASCRDCEFEHQKREG